jgi:uncharacterized protein YlaI
MRKYYYDTRGVLNDTSIELCKVKNNGIMIGSYKCQECEHCVESSDQKNMWEHWIICSKLEEALG